MIFNQNNNETYREDGMTVVQHAQPQTLHARCCKRKFKWNSGPNDYNELTEYQLITLQLYSWIFIENCDLITENDNL